MKRPAGEGLVVVFLDFDGVLHHRNVYRKKDVGPTIYAHQRYKLFMHAELLNDLFSPFPDVKIVLSTSWCVHYGFEHTAARLPLGLRERCIGATYHSRIPKGDWFATPRGEQVTYDAQRRRPLSWFAIDDDDEYWPEATRSNLVLTDPTEGISPLKIQAEITKKLCTSTSS